MASPTSSVRAAPQPGSQDAALELVGIVKRYGGPLAALGSRARPVLAGIDLVLRAGESTGLVGPNGSGKSTLLRLVAGVERPSAGAVRIFGRDPDEPAARARIGFLPDGFPFPLELSARAVLRLVAALHGLERRARGRMADEMLERVGLGPEARRPLLHFSLGMKRRFGLAQAFLHAPELVLLDEPTAGLDAPGHLVLEELVHEACARGATLLLATHVLSDLAEHCARACVLVSGRIVADGAASALLGDRRRLLELYRAHSAERG